jgi:hypothetical protein
MAEPEVALVFSPEAWVETLHRHLTDHGGARVRQVVMDPSLAFDEEYGTIVVSHRWPALTRTFVDAIHQRRRSSTPTSPGARSTSSAWVWIERSPPTRRWGCSSTH